MKTIKVKNCRYIPKNFTGVAEFPDETKSWYKEGKLHREDGPAFEHPTGSKAWYKNGKRHREDGPACEYPDGSKYWWIENEEYTKINIKNYLVLDHFEGKYGLIWYRLLDKDQILEYPDIPGLIEK